MIVLVTGASGFIGRHVVSALAANGHRPAVLLRSGSATDGLEAFVADARYGDLRDARALADAVRGVDAVIHLAGLTRAKSEAEFDRVNADGVTAMLRA